MQRTYLAPRAERRSVHADRPLTPLTRRTGPWDRCHLNVPRLARSAGRHAPRPRRIIGAVLARERGRRRANCAAALAPIGVYSFAFVPAVPSLRGHDPVLLEAPSASTAATAWVGRIRQSTGIWNPRASAETGS